MNIDIALDFFKILYQKVLAIMFEWIKKITFLKYETETDEDKCFVISPLFFCLCGIITFSSPFKVMFRLSLLPCGVTWSQLFFRRNIYRQRKDTWRYAQRRNLVETISQRSVANTQISCGEGRGAPFRKAPDKETNKQTNIQTNKRIKRRRNR